MIYYIYCLSFRFTWNLYVCKISIVDKISDYQKILGLICTRVEHWVTFGDFAKLFMERNVKLLVQSP